MEAEDEVEEEVDEDAIEKSEDEFESDDKETNEYYYQYEEIEIEKFHTRKLNKAQLQKFENFMERYQNLFTWDPNNFG
ncbi:hypothetical protein RCL_jg28885.t1 [Rhizophagus clarus]|uniref:Uncharacterized protein n=1 Tax=Rhizophagus clarus TaxID=94130 RepID=A0A8H3QUM7_9GLOM|nr:hypothetical protein RCL_jg28885.t1 [Rhizophagus clarus]